MAPFSWASVYLILFFIQFQCYVRFILSEGKLKMTKRNDEKSIPVSSFNQVSFPPSVSSPSGKHGRVLSIWSSTVMYIEHFYFEKCSFFPVTLLMELFFSFFVLVDSHFVFRFRASVTCDETCKSGWARRFRLAFYLLFLKIGNVVSPQRKIPNAVFFLLLFFHVFPYIVLSKILRPRSVNPSNRSAVYLFIACTTPIF